MQTSPLLQSVARIRAVFAGLTLAVSSVFAQSAASGIVSGRVDDARTSRYLVGVLVQVAGTNLRATTDDAGDYVLTGVPAGAQMIVFSYLGYPNLTRAVTVAGGGRILADATFGEEVVKMAEFVVESQVAGQARATNKQRTSDTLKNIVAADAVGQFPDQNVAEAFGRLPGLSLADDQGEARFVLIRGVQHRNNVTINGVSIPAPEDTIRQMALDVIPADVVSGLEVTKSATPDMPGNGVGGSLDIQTASAFDRKGKLYVGGRFEGAYNKLGDRWSPKVGLNASNTFSVFGGDNNFGVYIGASWYDRNYDTDNNENGPTLVNKTDPATGARPVYVRDLAMRDFNVNRERSGFTGNLDYRHSPGSKFYVRSLISNFKNREERNLMDVRYDGASTVVRLTDYEGEFNNVPNVDRNVQHSAQKQLIRAVNGGGDHQWGGWFVNYNVAWSTSIEDFGPEEQFTFIKNTTFNSAYTYAEGSRPSRIVVTGAGGVADYLNPANYRLRSYGIFTRYKENETVAAKLDVRRDFKIRDWPSYLKSGVSVSWADVFSDQEDVSFNWAGPVVALSNLEGPEADYPLYLFGPTVDFQKSKEFLKNNTGPAGFVKDVVAATRNGGAVDYRGTENVSAGYVMGKVDIDKLRLIGGVRVETTDQKLSGNSIILVGGVFNRFEPATNNKSYTNWLPSFHARYNASDRLIFRGAWSNTVSRQALSGLAPRRELLLEGNNPTANISNPDLKPLESINYDLSSEYYLARLGMVSLGLFYKDIKNTTFNVDSLETFEGVPGVSVRRQVNGPTAKLYGAELNFQQRLDFLPSPFDGLLWGVNYTRSNSDTYTRIDATRGFVHAPLGRHSKHFGSAFAGYEKYGLSARVSVTYRSVAFKAFRLQDLDRLNPDYTKIDASVSYRLNRRLKLYLEMTNLRDEPFYEYFGRIDGKGSQRLPLKYEEYDWNANLGVKWEL
jgi:TonB-dependent receptor